MSDLKYTIGIIGGGNMGAAIIGGVHQDYKVCVAEKDKRRAAYLRKHFRVVTCELKPLIENCSIIILAVKPQNFDDILFNMRQHALKNKLIISIAAGIPTAYIEKRLGKPCGVVRVMPNLPAQVKKGATAICLGKSAKRKDLILAMQIFQRIGTVVVVRERNIDAITAVSGSGPAYVFYFIEAFIKAAQSLGLKEEAAKELVIQTMEGSISLLKSQKISAKVLKERVTSKGGTTEAALKVFEQKQVKASLQQAMVAAKKRAKQLSRT